jgi:DeoR family transcriptional regulator, aga operon transcriptional repressor
MTAWVIPAERRALIVSALRAHSAVRISALCAELEVSEMTVRRDLKLLEHQGALTRTWGGAVLEMTMTDGPHHPQPVAHAAEKARVAEAAAAMIETGDTVFLGSGTTVAQTLRYVDSGIKVRIVTHSLAAAAEARSLDLELIFLGGLYHRELNAAEGSWPLDMIAHFRADKAFLGADGLDCEAGLTTPSLATTSMAVAGIELAMIGRTRGKVVVLADHSKIGLVGDVVICPLDQIDVVLVDDGVAAGVCEQIRRAGPRCEVV